MNDIGLLILGFLCGVIAGIVTGIVTGNHIYVASAAFTVSTVATTILLVK